MKRPKNPSVCGLGVPSNRRQKFRAGRGPAARVSDAATGQRKATEPRLPADRQTPPTSGPSKRPPIGSSNLQSVPPAPAPQDPEQKPSYAQVRRLWARQFQPAPSMHGEPADVLGALDADKASLLKRRELSPPELARPTPNRRHPRPAAMRCTSNLDIPIDMGRFSARRRRSKQIKQKKTTDSVAPDPTDRQRQTSSSDDASFPGFSSDLANAHAPRPHVPPRKRSGGQNGRRGFPPSRPRKAVRIFFVCLVEITTRARSTGVARSSPPPPAAGGGGSQEPAPKAAPLGQMAAPSFWGLVSDPPASAQQQSRICFFARATAPARPVKASGGNQATGKTIQSPQRQPANRKINLQTDFTAPK